MFSRRLYRTAEGLSLLEYYIVNRNLDPVMALTNSSAPPPRAPCAIFRHMTIIVKQVYWYMHVSHIFGERLQDHWSCGECELLKTTDPLVCFIAQDMYTSFG